MKKARYDELGEAGLGKNPTEKKLEDALNAFMGQSKIGKTKSCVHNIKLTLEELYTGVTRRIAVNRDRIRNGKVVKE